MAHPWLTALALEDHGNGKYSTLRNPERMGNALPIAYGGFALSVAMKAASASIANDAYHLYTIMGSYLGPAQVDRPLLASVTTIRQTRTFATRQVTVSQAQDDGKDRAVLVALADFQVAEPASLLEYSIPPSQAYKSWKELEPWSERGPRLTKEGVLGEGLYEKYEKSFSVMGGFFEVRPCPEGIFGQNLNGVAKGVKTTQDHLSITEKSTADWARLREPLSDQTENVTALAFFMDGALGFAPLSFNHMFLDDSGAASSLDFALRVFTNHVDMRQWHLREIQTKVAAEGRQYSEARIYDESGRCVAGMTQQCICRPLKKKQGKL